MNPERAKLRSMLTSQECEVDDWLFNLCNSTDVEDPERYEIESMGFGLLFRCMCIAAKRPDWPFFQVVIEAKRTVMARIPAQDLLKSRRQ